jgi:uncharacterized membrane protein YeaQ/YmgE (transglycosylase-associated protein family)
MDLTFVGWIVIGLVTGLISGIIVGGRQARGWMPSLVIGVIGSALAGWATVALGFSSITSLYIAAVFGTIGALLIRVVLKTVSFSDD